MLLRQIGKEKLFQEKEHKEDGPFAGGSLRSKGVKCREQGEGAGEIGRPGCPGPGWLWEEFWIFY